MRVAVVTTSRSEYSADCRIIKALEQNADFDLRLIVGGTHFSKEHGETCRDIEKDGFKDYYKLKTVFDSDAPEKLAEYVSATMKEAAVLLADIKPDILLLNGDRFELYAFAVPALLLNIPLAHIGGGEITAGAFDDNIRHSITKLAHFHFVSCEDYARNISRLGEEDWRIHIVGAEGLENIVKQRKMSLTEVNERIGLDLSKPTILITYHPATAEFRFNPLQQIGIVLEALAEFGGVQFLFTAPAPDPGAEVIREKIAEFCEKHPDNAKFIENLGPKLYINVARYVKCVAGNSSSGIIEIPFLKVPTINIGKRQDGRKKSKSVLDVPLNAGRIVNALQQVMNDSEYVAQLTSGPFLFGDGQVSGRVLAGLLKGMRSKNLMNKKLDFEVKQNEWNRYF